MKTIFTVLILLFAASAQAAPYLVCDPYPEDSQPTHYKMRVDGALVTTPYTVANGVSVVLDIGPLDNGKHAVTDIQACNERGCSDPPLAFSVPALPAKPSNIRLGY